MENSYSLSNHYFYQGNIDKKSILLTVQIQIGTESSDRSFLFVPLSEIGLPCPVLILIILFNFAGWMLVKLYWLLNIC